MDRFLIEEVGELESADVLEGAVVVTFDDGATALFSADLMRSMLPQAERLITESEEQSQE